MKGTWIGLVVIAMLVGAVLLAKSTTSGPEPEPAASREADDARRQPEVILFADPREAGASCGCGEIFRAVRAAGARGVRTREVDPEREREVVRRYRVTVEPTVVFVDPTGRETARREGESADTIASLQADLDRLARGRS